MQFVVSKISRNSVGFVELTETMTFLSTMCYDVCLVCDSLDRMTLWAVVLFHNDTLLSSYFDMLFNVCHNLFMIKISD